mgnify:CR=1 FL=1
MLQKIIISTILLGLPWIAPNLVQAQAYPNKMVKIVVPYPAGGGVDFVGRTISQRLSDIWGQPVTIENKSGASGSIGADYVAKSKPDGLTLLLASPAEVLVGPIAGQKTPYDPQKDLIPVVGVAATPHILIVNNNSKVRSVADLIAALKANPGKLSFASSGIGNSDHMAGELFLATTGLQAIHVPYKGGSPAATDVLGGQIDFYFAGMPVGLPLYKGEKVRALAVTSKNRFSGAPELLIFFFKQKTAYEMALWQGLFVPAGTSKEIINLLNSTIMRLLDTPELKDRFIKAGVQIAPMNTQQFTDLYNSDIARWKVVIEKAKIKLD